jgi:WS/DGAT/MGAT family acyltransferase
MSAQHLEGLDSAFITLDAPNTPLHVGIILELEPSPSTPKDPSSRYEEIRGTIERRLGKLSALRRRVLRVPFDLGPPLVVDDPDFDLSFHVVRRALPSPGGPEELEALVARVMAKPLAPDRPMWEISVIEGLENGRTALLAKIHHAIADGISGVAVFAHLFDLDPDKPREFELPEPGPVAAIPSPVELLARSSSELLRRPGAFLEVLGTGLERMADRVDELMEELPMSPPTLWAAPKTSLSGTISHGRSFERTQLCLSEVKAASKSFGGTVTDFAMSALAGALRRLLEGRGEQLDRELVAFMPVNVRSPGTESELGNRISARLVPMASHILDPQERLAVLAQRAAKLREGRGSENDLLNDFANAVGPAVASAAGRIVGAFELFEHLPNVANVVLSSVPGPPIPLWCAGERIVRASPMGPLMFNQALNVTVLGYCDSLEFGILACPRKVPELSTLRALLEEEASAILAEAGTQRQASSA